MAISQTSVPTQRAAQYLNQLCKHWNHRFPVTYTPYEGWVPFSASKVCKLDAEEDRLRIRLSVEDGSELEQMQQVVEEHLRRFAFREELGAFLWQSGDEGEPFATPPESSDEESADPGAMREHAVRVRGRAVVLTYSEGPGRPLLLLHDIEGSSRSFLPIMSALEAADFRPLAMNMPGYGGSDLLAEAYPSVGQFAEHLVELLDEIAVERVDILGHSLGALLASALANAHPDRIGRMVLSSPPAGFGLGDPDTWPESRTGYVADLIAEGPGLYAENHAAALCADDASADAVEAVKRQMERLTPEGLRAGCSLLARADLRKLLTGSTVPVQFLSADQDRIVPPALVAEHGAALGRPVVRMSGVGHAGYVENADLFARSVLNGFSSIG